MDFSKFFRELFGLFLLFWAAFLLLSLLTFDANDPSVNVVKTGVQEINNRAGMFGAYSAGFLNDIFGIGGLFWPFVFAFIGVAYISSKVYMRWWRWAGIFLLALCVLTISSAFDLAIGDLEGGGVIGATFYQKSQQYLSPAGTCLLWVFVTLAGLQLAFNFSWVQSLKKGYKKILESYGGRKNLKLSFPAKDGFRNFLFVHWKKFRQTATELAKNKARGAISAFQKNQSGQIQAPETVHPAPVQLPLHNPAPLVLTQETAPSSSSVPAIIPENANSVGNEGQVLSEKEASADAIPVSDATDEWLIETDAEAESEEQATVCEDRENVFRHISLAHEPVMPAPDLLQPAPVRESVREDLEAKGKALIKCFADFDIKGALVQISPGPVVTMFEFKPDPGIRISKIANLSDELSLALKAVAVRIQAPIPGSDTVGIEIPNEIREIVSFRELVESPEFQNSHASLPMILGKNIFGHPYMADLAEMPHLLVAGATGAGKSVCLNSILVSMLYKCTPEDMRLLLVDPKRVEMAVYSDLPHLVHPVVTDMNDAKNALEWATHEMEQRFDAMKLLGARNVSAYNQKLASLGSNRMEEYENLEHLPYLVIVIDELADLMMTAAREVQNSIVRLAQLARAAGIHMILATQRPSVDVVTGLIKANFINRISFQVTSKHDSRTILDQSGAEYLLGRGDMLFKPKGGKLLRLHGPFLSDEEVQMVANHWKSQMPPEYDVDFSSWNAENKNLAAGEGEAGSDPLYEDAREFVVDQGRASISQLQRRFNIGFARAGRLVDQLEKGGVIGPANGSKPRQVIQN